MTLTPRRTRFVDEYMKDRNATHAAIRAGYSPNGARNVGSILIADYRVRAEIDRRAAALSELSGVTTAKVIEKLWDILRADIADYLIEDPDGHIRIDRSKLVERAASIATLVTDDGPANESGEGRQKTMIRLHDKIAAADKLLRHLGAYRDRVEHTGRDGGPIEVAMMTDQERLDALKALVARVKAAGGNV